MRAVGRWNQILERQIPLKLLSSPAAPFEHQSSISICLTVTSYKIATWKRENVSLSVYASTVCAYVCSVMCFHNSLSESAYLRVPTFKTQQLHQSSLLSPLISHHPTSCSLALRLHLSFQPSLLSVSFSSSLVSLFFFFLFSFFSYPHLTLSPPFPLLHLPSLAVTYIFPWWWAKARLYSSFCSCWSPASSDSPGIQPELFSRLLLIQPWRVLSSLFSRSSPQPSFALQFPL